ncbi:MAG: cupin domain-containing protein [Alphaproteobacteria bacterium]|nr:cupin domain-containing protein [Alphaproteobacteria bacterium]MDX5368746.1 cupin domain-containing protein [Alphaproteobacteria bacterium]MDX5463486.1 cupin domain-containing protein [Alphaproteobacteria bacterium]
MLNPKKAKSSPSNSRRSTDSLGDTRSVGEQLRTIRRQRRLSLQQVADASGLSIAFVSQVERNLSTPSLNSLQALCNALRIPIGWVFSEPDDAPPEERGRIVRTNGRKTLRLDKKGIRKELLTPDLGGKLQMVLVQVEPGGSSGKELYHHDGEECGHVLSGQLTLIVDEDVYDLKEGDSFRFSSKLPHGFRNPSEVPCTVVWVTTPPFY